MNRIIYIYECWRTSPTDILGSFYDGFSFQTMRSFPGGKVNILGGHSIGHSKQNKKCICICVLFRKGFRDSYFAVQFQIC
jgi:hypothetical protein